MSHCPLSDKTPQLLLLITLLVFWFQQLQYGEYFLLLPDVMTTPSSLEFRKQVFCPYSSYIAPNTMV